MIHAPGQGHHEAGPAVPAPQDRHGLMMKNQLLPYLSLKALRYLLPIK
jgi:hypothetical protein